MPYEIPQQLEYKEKIVFGLNFNQLIYLAVALPFIFALFFKTPFNIYIRSILALIPTSIAAAFMFLNLENHIVNWYKWLKFREVKDAKKLQSFVGLNKIEDNLIHIKNKKLAVLKVTPLNFAIKREDEREALTMSFQKFLNALDFPIQILMDTEKLDLDEYLASLENRVTETSKKSKMDYSKLFEKYKEHLKNAISNSEVKNRNFYLIIPESTNIDIQLEICKDFLKNLHLKTKRLNTKELEALISKYFNGSKKLYPEKIDNSPDNIKVGETLSRIVYAHGYPRVVESGFLDRIVRATGEFDFSIHINPYPIETMMVLLNKELQKQRSDLYAASLKSIINPSLEIKYNDTRKILDMLQKGSNKLFNVSLYISCKARDKSHLDLLTKKVESELNAIMIQPKVALFRMAQGFKSVAPFGKDEMGAIRNVTTEALSAFFPFTSPFLQVDPTGVWLGLNKNNIPIIKDIFNLSNPNGLILSQSGGGKSYFSKLLISRYLLNGTKVMVIDPQGEYKELVNYFKGQRVDLSRDSKTIINPLDLMGHDYMEKRLSLMDLMPIMLGDLSEPQKAFMDRALTEAYRKKGITDDPKTWHRVPPKLGDVLYELKKFKKKVTQIEQNTLISLINRLSMYVEGVFKFLNNHTNIDFNNRFVCFDIGNLPKQVKPVMMFLVLDYVYTKMKSDLERKILLIDEAWSLLSRTEDATYIFEIVKTCRKFNLGLLLINQEVGGLLNSEAGKSVLANSAYTLLMRQKPAVIKSICNTFSLSKSERNYLLTAGVGEGIIIMEDEHSEIKVVASTEEHKIITTKADEILEQKAVNVKKPVKVEIKVDEHKGFYRHKDLNKYEVEYLLERDYQIIEKKGISLKKKEKFLVKPRFNESAEHVFLIYDIAEYLKRKGIKVKLNPTENPDIAFEINKKKIGIEVETGKRYKTSKKELFKKVDRLNQKYDGWFFVLTNKNLIPKYRKIWDVIDNRWLITGIDKVLKKAENCPQEIVSGRRLFRRQKNIKNG